jgi:hypothetical protein
MCQHYFVSFLRLLARRGIVHGQKVKASGSDRPSLSPITIMFCFSKDDYGLGGGVGRGLGVGVDLGVGVAVAVAVAVAVGVGVGVPPPGQV